jgi:hypothetical protein
VTVEKRISRAERLLKMFARSGRKYRNEFSDTLNILIHMQVREKEEYLARQRKLDEKIDILIATQSATEEQMKETGKRIEALGARTETLAARTETLAARIEAWAARTSENLDRLAASQAKTDKALQRFLDGLNKGRNGNSTD